MLHPSAELLRRYAEDGSEEAFTQLVRACLPLVYNSARRQLDCDAHLAEDVAQFVFSRLARKATSLTTHPSIVGWLHLTTRFAANEVKRREQRRRIREQEVHAMHELLSGNESPSRSDWERLRPVIDDAIGGLNPEDRETVLLRFFAGQPLAVVGAKLEVSENAARMRVERALEKLQVLLAKRGVTSTGAALALAFGNQAGHAVPVNLAATIANTALAASTGSIAAAGIIGFMSKVKVSAVTVAVVGLFSIGAAVYEVRTSREADAQLAEKRREVYALGLRVDEAERQAKQSRLNLAPKPGPRTTTSAINSTAVEDEGRGPFGPRPAGSRARGRALLAAYPEIRELLIKDTRARIAGRYRSLYEELGLSETQIEAFEMIKIAGVSSGYEGPQGVSYTLDAMPVLPKGDGEARLRELLGERGFQRLRDYEKSQDSRVTQVASALFFTDTPLTADQGIKLQRVLAEAYQLNKSSSPPVYWNAVRAAAESFLSAPQLAAVSSLQAEDEFNQARMANQSPRYREGTPQ